MAHTFPAARICMAMVRNANSTFKFDLAEVSTSGTCEETNIYKIVKDFALILFATSNF